jgi:hypothetical protein
MLCYLSALYPTDWYYVVVIECLLTNSLQVFRIGDGKCTPIQKFHYNGRCAVPPAITNDEYAHSGLTVTPAPSYGGTAKPTGSVFGTGQGSANAHRTHDGHTMVELGAMDGIGSAAGDVNAELELEAEDGPQDHGDGFQLLQKLMQKRSAPQDGHFEIGQAAQGSSVKATAQELAERNAVVGDDDKQ